MVPFFTERFTTQSQNFDDTEGLSLLEVGADVIWGGDTYYIIGRVSVLMVAAPVIFPLLERE